MEDICGKIYIESIITPKKLSKQFEISTHYFIFKQNLYYFIF